MLDHGLEAREISRRGRQWITDLVFHPDAKWENDQVLMETLRRYRLNAIQPGPFRCVSWRRKGRSRQLFRVELIRHLARRVASHWKGAWQTFTREFIPESVPVF